MRLSGYCFRARLGNITIVNTYVPQGRALDDAMYPYKLKWFRRLRKWFDRRFGPDDLVVWTGDLNVAATAIDVHHPEQHENHVCYHIDVRKAFAACCARGFVDVFRKHHPEPGQFTFFDYRTVNAVKRGLGWRVDYILASRALAAKSVDAHIDLAPRLGPKPSDHTFLAAEFS